eukprot:m.20201 g.20201  ORF g.20201 m.20201 type:complete len:61 (-) comp5224_c1_seq1:92-274(-)
MINSIPSISQNADVNEAVVAQEKETIPVTELLEQQRLFDSAVAAHQHTPESFALSIPKWK